MSEVKKHVHAQHAQTKQREDAVQKTEKQEQGFPKIYVYFGLMLVALVAVAGIVLFMDSQKPTPPVVVENVAKYGDGVLFDYVARDAGGKVIDTSIKQVAVDAGVFVEGKTYVPAQAMLQLDASGLVKGVEKALVGMREGEEKNVTLSPGEAYGEWKGTRLVTIPRESTISRVQTYEVSTLVEMAGIPESGMIEGANVTLSGWQATVLEKTNSSVKIKNNPELGQNFSIPSAAMGVKISYGDYVSDEKLFVTPLAGTITEVSENEMKYRLEALEATRYYKQDANGVIVEARLYSSNETSIVLDYNHPLAGKTLAYQLKIVKITSG
ncbi:FKBP-type peptidyl-prolyl cis-trans isomerase [Candidatus Micrarchaeota archaeon]|nr:FKBP-type peptidyl-prolyl cis-trans isomerase [Candidatus Micrarchaeota archaeon]